jgi:hypothetical protein
MSMNTQDLENFCTDWLAAWTGNRPERLLSFYKETAFYRDPARPNGLSGHAALGAYFTKLLAKNPDWIWKALEIVPTEKGFALKWETTIPVGERTIVETGLDLVELENGKISRNEVYFDPARLNDPENSA